MVLYFDNIDFHSSKISHCLSVLTITTLRQLTIMIDITTLKYDFFSFNVNLVIFYQYIFNKKTLILQQIDNIDNELKIYIYISNCKFLADVRFVISIITNNPKVQCSLLVFVLFLCVNFSCFQIVVTNMVAVDYDKKVLTSNIQIIKYMNRSTRRSKNLMTEFSILTLKSF